MWVVARMWFWLQMWDWQRLSYTGTLECLCDVVTCVCVCVCVCVLLWGMLCLVRYDMSSVEWMMGVAGFMSVCSGGLRCCP